MRIMLAAALVVLPLSVHAEVPGGKHKPEAKSSGAKSDKAKSEKAKPAKGKETAAKSAADKPKKGKEVAVKETAGKSKTTKPAAKLTAKAVVAKTLAAKPAATRSAVLADTQIPAAAIVRAPAPVVLSSIPSPSMRDGDGIPDQLDPVQRTQYRAVFAAIRGQQWGSARAQLDAMKGGPLHSMALAELLTAKNSPKADLAPLLAVMEQAPDLPQADQLSRMAFNRGAVSVPRLPSARRLVWYDAPPVRQRMRTVSTGNAAMEMALAVQPFVKADDGVSAEALLERLGPGLSQDSLTEWQQKVAWIYYTAGDDVSARRMAGKAQAGIGEWTAQADWVQGLSAWRQNDCQAAGIAFESVAQRAADGELRSAGLYWASRADTACGRPERVSNHLRAAAQYGETFYGLLARQALGIEDSGNSSETFLAADWRALERRPNIRTAAALIEIGENRLADEVLKYQATIGDPQEHEALTRLAGRFNLPSTQLWLSNHLPAGTQPVMEARYPAPNWTPAGGWRVDKALVYAHTLQESRFNSEIRSAAGAMGLMQVKMGAATDVGRRSGRTYASSDLTKPAVNMEIGQSYLEQLRDSPMTQGLLPKVIASYNAGPSPVQAWNTEIRDNGDPLLYIESIPYWETRGYVMTVLRNYWMYEGQEHRKSVSREALVQGLWPKFPGLPGGPVKVAPSQYIAPRSVATIPAPNDGY
jgi:soluble lytic murein transglycosylase